MFEGLLAACRRKHTVHLAGRGFEDVVLPHLDAAYNLARWLVRNPQDAEDIVQEACLSAPCVFSAAIREGNARAWLLLYRAEYGVYVS